MEDLTQEEKELIIVVLGNALSEPEDAELHPKIADLYEKLRLGWLDDPTTYHTAKEILDIAGG